MKKFEVHLYFDGPAFHEDAVIKVPAENEADAVREAMVYAGLPKIGEVKELT